MTDSAWKVKPRAPAAEAPHPKGTCHTLRLGPQTFCAWPVRETSAWLLWLKSVAA